MKKKVIIIGAGISGISAGIYLQMNGYDTEIFEQGSSAGGLCTGWRRKGYHFDGCIHWLVGTKPSVSIYNIWNEIIDMEKLDVVDYSEYCAIDDDQGSRFTAYTDIDKLQKEMERISPEDTEVINEFIGSIKKLLGYNLPVEKPMEFMSLSEKWNMMKSMLPNLAAVLKWSRISNRDFAGRFKSPLLRRFLTSSYPQDYSALTTIINCGWLYQKGAGYPVGGSLRLIELMVKKYLDCGGKINYHSKVEKILVKDDSACGVVLEDQSVHNSDMIISSADGYSTIYRMLEGKYTGKKIQDIYEKHSLRTQAGMMFASIGVARTFEQEPHWVFIPLSKKLHIDHATELDELAVTINNFDPTAAPEGKTCITLMLSSNDYQYWTNLRENDLKRYLEEKRRIGDEIIEALDLHFKDIKGKVETCDIATPATYIRYTGLWKASLGWCATKKTFFENVPKELKGLNNFYMAGQWVEIGGGVPMCMISGRNAAQRICKKDGVEFMKKNHDK